MAFFKGSSDRQTAIPLRQDPKCRFAYFYCKKLNHLSKTFSKSLWMLENKHISEKLENAYPDSFTWPWRQGFWPLITLVLLVLNESGIHSQVSNFIGGKNRRFWFWKRVESQNLSVQYLHNCWLINQMIRMNSFLNHHHTTQPKHLEQINI
jgi:hypothetical protein